jgi:hypothetical protein
MMLVGQMAQLVPVVLPPPLGTPNVSFHYHNKSLSLVLCSLVAVVLVWQPDCCCCCQQECFDGRVGVGVVEGCQKVVEVVVQTYWQLVVVFWGLMFQYQAY